MNKILTIAIPVYNRIEALKYQLEYIKRNYINEIEVIVSDNNSNDGTEEYLMKFSEKHSWLKYNINKYNIGPINNMYKLAEKAKGKYIFMWGDDYLSEDFLEYIINILKENDITFMHCNYAHYDKDLNNIIYGTNKIYRYRKKIYSFTNNQIIKILKDAESDLLFSSSNIYLTRIVKDNSRIIDTDSDIDTLMWAVDCMKEGLSFIDNKYWVVNDPNIAWNNLKNFIYFDCFNKYYNSLKDNGFNKRKINNLIRYHEVKGYITLLKNKNNNKTRKNIMKKYKFNTFLLMVKIVLQWILRKINFFSCKNNINIMR